MKKAKLTGWPPRVIAQLPYPKVDDTKPDTFDYILQLAQEEEDSGHAENAAQLRAVPELVEALQSISEWCEHKEINHGPVCPALEHARRALAPFAEVGK
jgi:hypothetical protein